MTNNQIAWAQHKEQVRHNQKMEAIETHSAESSRITANANKYNSETNYQNMLVARENAKTNAFNADTNYKNWLNDTQRVAYQGQTVMNDQAKVEEQKRANDIKAYLAKSQTNANEAKAQADLARYDQIKRETQVYVYEHAKEIEDYWGKDVLRWIYAALDDVTGLWGNIAPFVD